MSPVEALNILERVTANVNGTRRDHLAVIQALQVIGDALKPKEEKKDEKKK